jgi:hypothetical protein
VGVDALEPDQGAESEFGPAHCDGVVRVGDNVVKRKTTS